MKISYNWLKQFIKIDWDAEKTAELLTNLGLEVEGISTYESVKGGLEGVVVGRVLTCHQHPNADRLKVTTVDVGGTKPLQIVCGAPNVAAGQNVPVATIGTTLYTTDGTPWKIKKGKIRGEESHGMICAEDELGIGKSHDGITVLDNKIKTGIPVSEIFNIEKDKVFEIGLTPNRADAMSHFGVARDLKAGLLQQEINLELITPSASAFHVDNRQLTIDIDVLDEKKCPHYAGLSISDIKVSQSPEWLQHRLKAIGLTPINNVVDATNYILHELGQPLHAFDADKIKGKKIEVKTCKSGTKFITLDGVERKLDKDDLMICDAEKPMCIAGVFGGNNSGVTKETTRIFIESAYFNPVSIRKTAKRHGLNTDASFRFERGVDPNATIYALKIAALLITEIAGGIISSDISDTYPNKIKDFELILNYNNVNKLIGQEIPKENIKSILTSLDIQINNITESGVGLTIPSYRNDVQREADLIEEILRVYGYNKIEASKKLNASIVSAGVIKDYQLQNNIANQLVAQGFFEIMTNSLTKKTYTQLSNQISDVNSVKMLNPLSTDLGVMRQSMLFSSLEALAHNINRKRNNLKLFEFGKTYHQNDGKREEHKHLALLVSGNIHKQYWNSDSKPSDFFYLKGILEAVFERFGINHLTTSPNSEDIFSEAISYTLGKKNLVSFGLIKKSILNHFGISQPVLYANFNWDSILETVSKKNILIKPISKYPEVRRDFSLLIDEVTRFSDIVTLAKQTEKKLLKSIDLFDVYIGDKLPKGKKSYAVSFILQDDKKTLTDNQIDKIMAKLQFSFENQLNAILR